MHFNTKALALTVGLIWGGLLLVVSLANLIWPGYGQAFLNLMASVYPGYQAAASIGQVGLGTIYGLLDGLIAGLIFGWLYNLLSTRASAGTR